MLDWFYVLNGYGMHDGGWWMWIVGGIMMLFFWGLLLWGIIFVVRNVGGRGGADSTAGGRSDAPSDAEQILRGRFARGEIESDEFRARLDELQRWKRG